MLYCIKGHSAIDIGSMVPRVPALAQSESKAKFFERLGLSDQNDVDKRLYLMMKVSLLSVPVVCM